MPVQMGKFILNWKTDQIYVRMERAQSDGLNDTAEAIRDEAKRRVREATGHLKAHIKVIKKASKAGGRTQIKVGVEDVDYAMAQETGPVNTTRRWGFTPYLRPSYQIESKRLAARIKERFKNNG